MRPAPKIELHVHLEGTVRPRTLLAIARRNGAPLPARTEAELARHYRFVDFAHFIEVWIATTNCLRGYRDFRQVVVDYAAEAARHGAVYLEGIFSPAERVRRGVRWADIFGGYADGAVEAYERHGVVVRLTPDIDRELDPALAQECARQAVRYRDRGVVGFGIGGREAAAGLARYARAIAVARDGGLGFVPHAGEVTGVASVREALRYDPVRLRHGVRAADDPGVAAELVDRGVVLDVCPTSNLRTRVVRTLDSHPLPVLRAAGVACSIGTDDPAMFGTDLSREYALAARLGVGAADAYAAGLAGALCDEPTRAHLARVGRSAFAALS
ncbi:adenosine deaminase [Micromonospora auratinigra]|uniref:Aminodeoxyfutalosine deaminase n=1 Tax=Micromonospora auratinigra TaxID=261654 RepID=A0A1A8ZGP8_9ACTN|nr:adenosine deaminase [Micromonospora auratinigra]SBT43018.1 aminodeoxyfutalosine deaminase [Micromonospora auratinigra]